MKNLILVFLVGLLACQSRDHIESVVYSSPDDEQAILAVMEMQEKAWNDGDIDEFMEGYWNSGELTFVGNSGIQKGWDATLQRYLSSYPDKEAMGDLTFEVIRMNRLSGAHYHMIGRYTLKRTEDQLTGLFSLIWRKIDGKWLIIADHTC